MEPADLNVLLSKFGTANSVSVNPVLPDTSSVVNVQLVPNQTFSTLFVSVLLPTKSSLSYHLVV
jgi:hypothetical protein